MAVSQNNWPVIDSGTSKYLAPMPYIIGKVRKDGGVLELFTDLAVWFDAYVEDLDKGRDDWGYNYRPIRGQSTGFSNHASGTAVDFNAMIHPRGKTNTFSPDQQEKIRKRLREVYKGTIRWGGDYDPRLSKKDDMHFEINGSESEIRAVLKTLKTPDVVPVEDKVDPIDHKTDPVYKFLSREDALAVQKYLKRVTGDYTGKEDGVYGPMMLAAVKGYQRRQNQYGEFGLVVDGEWGPKTQAHYDWVKMLQDNTNDWAASKRLGSLPEDGDFGHLSWRHVKEVQRVNMKTKAGAYWKAGGRVADGVPGPVYCKMLKIENHPK